MMDDAPSTADYAAASAREALQRNKTLEKRIEKLEWQVAKLIKAIRPKAVKKKRLVK